VLSAKKIGGKQMCKLYPIIQSFRTYHINRHQASLPHFLKQIDRCLLSLTFRFRNQFSTVEHSLFTQFLDGEFDAEISEFMEKVEAAL
jgi:hypothetical protein